MREITKIVSVPVDGKPMDFPSTGTDRTFMISRIGNTPYESLSAD